MISHDDAIETMKNFAKQGASVGIFWYDISTDELVGVSKIPAAVAFDNKRGSKTTPVLHKDFFPAIAGRFPNAFTFMDIERGRVFYDYINNKYIIKVGDWAQKYPKLKELIIAEFKLDGQIVEISQDEHWNLGRGESDLYI
jgi:hypothetical protein